MATVFDGDNLLITLDTPTNGVLTVDVQRLYSEWKEWQLDAFQNMGYPPAFRPDGGSDLTPGIKQGAYYFLRNDYGWRIQSTDADQTVYVIGNLTPQDSTLPIVIERAGRTVAYQGLQPITQNVSQLLELQIDADYGGIVYIDEANGTAGQAAGVGSVLTPSDNLTDALAILVRVGGKKIRFYNTLTLDQDLEGYDIEGAEAVTSNMLLLEGYSVDRSIITSSFISGAQGGTIVGFQAIRCGIQTITSFACGAEDCVFFSSVTLKPDSTNLWQDCKSGVAANAKFICNGNGGDELQVRGWIGGFDLRDVTNAEFRGSIDFKTGRLAIRNTCTAGETVIGGDVSKDNMEQAGMTVTDNSTAKTLMRETVESTFSLEEVLRLLGAAAAGTIEQATDGTYTIRGLDGTTARILGALGNNNGRNITSRDAA